MDSIPEKLVTEARCEITWGRPPEEVLARLQSEGVGDKHAVALIEELMHERALAVRSKGIGKIVLGSFFMAAPVAYWAFSMVIRLINLKLLGGLVVLGLFGFAKIVDGLMMMLRPRSSRVDLADNE